MKKIDWVRKLTSRKLWTAVASFVSMMILARRNRQHGNAGNCTHHGRSVRGGLHHRGRLDRLRQHRCFG